MFIKYSINFSYVCVAITSLAVAAPIATRTSSLSSQTVPTALAAVTTMNEIPTTSSNNLLSSSLHLLISKFPSSTSSSESFQSSRSSSTSSTKSSLSSALAAISTVTSSKRTARSVSNVTDIKIDQKTLTQAINSAKSLNNLLEKEFSILVKDVTIQDVGATSTSRSKIVTEIIQDAKDCTNKLTIFKRIRSFLLACQPWIEALPKYNAGTKDMALIVIKFENFGVSIMDMLPTGVIKVSPNTRTVPTQDLSVVLKTLASYYTQTHIIIQIFTDLGKC